MMSTSPMGSTASIPTTDSLSTLTAVQVADMQLTVVKSFPVIVKYFSINTSEDVITLLCSLGITNSEHQSTLSYRLMQAQGIGRHTSDVGLPSLTAVNAHELVVLNEQGQHVEATVLCEKTMSFTEKRLGADHPDTLSSVYDLACLLDQQGTVHNNSVLCSPLCTSLPLTHIVTFLSYNRTYLPTSRSVWSCKRVV